FSEITSLTSLGFFTFLRLTSIFNSSMSSIAVVTPTSAVISTASNSSKKSSSTLRYLAIKSLILLEKELRVFSIPSLYVFVTSSLSFFINLLFNFFIKLIVKPPIIQLIHLFLLILLTQVVRRLTLASSHHIIHLLPPLYLFGV